jgi:hypothetical protein
MALNTRLSSWEIIAIIIFLVNSIEHLGRKAVSPFHLISRHFEHVLIVAPNALPENLKGISRSRAVLTNCALTKQRRGAARGGGAAGRWFTFWFTSRSTIASIAVRFSLHADVRVMLNHLQADVAAMAISVCSLA